MDIMILISESSWTQWIVILNWMMGVCLLILENVPAWWMVVRRSLTCLIRLVLVASNDLVMMKALDLGVSRHVLRWVCMELGP